MALTPQRRALSQGPTDPAAATVGGIVQPAVPQAMGIAPTVANPSNVPPATTTAAAPASGIGPAATTASSTTPAGTQTLPSATGDLPAVQNDNISDILTGITSQDSPMMKLARTQGLQQANARGVLNSSIGIGASEAEAYKAALPVALQQGSQAAQSNQQRYDLSQQMARLNAQAGYDQLARQEGYEYQSALNKDSYAFQAQQLKNQQQFEKDMAAVQQGYAVDMAGLQYTLQSKLQSQANDEQIARMGVDLSNQMTLQTSQAANVLAQIKAQGDQQLALQANQFQEAMKELTLQLNSQDSIAAANAAVNLFNAEASLRAALLNNPNIPAAERAAYEQQISSMTAPVQQYVGSILGYTPAAGTGAGTSPAPVTGGTGGIGPTSYTGPSKSEIMAMQNDGVKQNFQQAAAVWNYAHPNDPITIPGAKSGGGASKYLFGVSGALFG